MKKYLFITISAALALTACTNETTEYVGDTQAREIAFAPLAQKATRAAVNGTDFPTTNTMEIAAYRASATAGNYFTKCTFSRQEITTGNYAWIDNTNHKYWPLSPIKLNFFAVSGAGLTNSHITIADDLSTASVAYTSSNYTTDIQSDIMYAFGRGEVTQAADNSLNFNSGNNVTMVFNHTQAQVKFRIKAGNDATASAGLQITSITLNGAKYQGTLTLTNTNATTESSAVTTTVAWSSVSDAVATVNVPGFSSPHTLTTTFYPADNSANLLIIPGTGNGFTSFTINYTLGNNAYSYTYTPSPAIANAEVAKVYNYDITMTLHEITVNPSVTDWTDHATYTDVPVG